MNKFFLTFLLVLGLCVPASAGVWTDDVNHWSGWGNGSGEDAKDTIGDPEYNGGEVFLNENLLTRITLDYTKHELWSVTENGEYFVAPGDLFIDVNSDLKWDYVAVSSFDIAGDPGDSGTWQSWTLYGFETGIDLNDSNAYRTTVSGTQHVKADNGKTYDIRNSHPIAVDGQYLSDHGSMLGDIRFAGLPDPGNGEQTTFWDFTGLDFTTSSGGLDVGEETFIFAFASRCANDVVFYEAPIPGDDYQEAPIPGAVWLLGSGLLGLVSMRRKFRK